MTFFTWTTLPGFLCSITALAKHTACCCWPVPLCYCAETILDELSPVELSSVQSSRVNQRVEALASCLLRSLSLTQKVGRSTDGAGSPSIPFRLRITWKARSGSKRHRRRRAGRDLGRGMVWSKGSDAVTTVNAHTESKAKRSGSIPKAT